MPELMDVTIERGRRDKAREGQAAGVGDPAPDDQADAEACLAHAPVTDAEATPDDRLPPATGGVALI